MADLTGGNTRILLEACSPEVFSENAFRLLAIPVDASDRDIKRAAERKQLQSKLSSASASDPSTPEGEGEAPGVFSVSSSAEAVREAVQRLRDPTRRVIEAFFWYWPLQRGRDASDPGMVAILRGKPESASEFWTKHIGDARKGGIALHNLAILSHQAALEGEVRYAAGDARHTTAERDREWAEVFARWRDLIAHDAFWSAVEDLIRTLDDPRVTIGLAQSIRQGLSYGLLTVNARSAFRASEQGQVRLCNRHLRIMDRSGFDPALIEQAKLDAIAPIRERIKVLSGQVEGELEAGGLHGDTAARQLMTETRPLLETVDRFLPEDHPTRNGLHDEVASRALAAIKAFANKTEDYATALDVLSECESVAMGASVRLEIQEAAARIREQSESEFRWRGSGYHDLPAAAIQGLEAAREQLGNGNLDEAVDAISSLVRSYEDRLTPQEGRLLEKPLALCLTVRAGKRLDEAFRELREPPTILRQALTRQDFAANLRLSGLVCGACGCYLWGEYISFEYESLPIKLCRSCGDVARREHESRRSKVIQAVTAAAVDLIRAAQLDPLNATIQKRLVELRELAHKLRIGWPSASQVPKKPAWARPGPVARQTVPVPPKSSSAKWIAGVGGVVLLGAMVAILARAGRGSDHTGVVWRPTPTVVTATSSPTVTPVPSTSTPTPGPELEVAVDMANLRSGPGMSYSVVTVLPLGTRVLVNGIAPDGIWLMVEVPEEGAHGWMAMSVLSSGVDLTGVPTVEFETATPSLTPTRQPTKTPTPTRTRQPTATRQPSSTPALTLNVTIEIVNQTGTAMSFHLDGPIARYFVVPAWGSETVYLSAGMYRYTVTAVGFKTKSGTEYFAPGDNITWSWSQAP